MSAEEHPKPDEIFAWVSGLLRESKRVVEVERHLSWCTNPCGEYLAISTGLVANALEELAPELTAPPRTRTYASTEELLRQRAAADAVVDAPAPKWPQLLEAAGSDTTQATFLVALAERAVFRADERPQDVLDGAESLRRVIEASEGLERPQALALLHLAIGIAERTLGRHLGALQTFDLAESHVAARAMSHEYARICLGRAGALRRLERFDEAEQQLLIAGQVFGRLGLADSEGLAKVYHLLANVAWQTGNARRAFRFAVKAARLFHEDGSSAQAKMALDPALSALIALRRPSPATRLYAYLAPAAETNPHWSARLLWKRGKLEAVRGGADAAYLDLRTAAERLGALGSPLGAAQVLLDLAHFAAAQGDVATQAEAARGATQLLSGIPGHPSDLEAAIGRLRDALQTGIGLAEVVARLRPRLQRL